MNKIFIISGQSGVGKNTIIEKVLKHRPGLYKAVTATTRQPRIDEVDGRDYYFLSEKEFKDTIKAHNFLEYAHVHDWLYGTPKSEITRANAQNKSILLVIDVHGAVNIKKMHPEAVLIFLSYESGDLDNLIRKRIKNDASRNFSEKEILHRIASAQKEAEYKKYYDYIVENPEGQPEKAVGEIEKIIQKHE